MKLRVRTTKLNNYFKFFILIVYGINLELEAVNIQDCNSDGMYRIIHDNGTWECVSCTLCPAGTIISRPCRYNRDTECTACPQETFVPIGSSECVKCTSCPPGYHVQRDCKATEDRNCTLCVEGFFSKATNSIVCKRCGVCRHNEKILQQCNTQSNTICGECNNNHYRETSSLKCVPCSHCHDKTSVKVTECIRKLGKTSRNVCQLQHFVIQKDSTTDGGVTAAKDNGKAGDTTMDPLVLTLPVVIITSVICCAVACLAMLRYVFRHRHKSSVPHNNVIFQSASITLLENEPERTVTSKSHSKHDTQDSKQNVYMEGASIVNNLQKEALLKGQGSMDEITVESTL